jgi:hypothetical protein
MRGGSSRSRTGTGRFTPFAAQGSRRGVHPLREPADAPELDFRLEIYRPRNCTKPGLEPVTDQALRVLAELGVEGRVSGRDVRTGVDIWTGSAPPT